jgi:hypothetical protein
MRTIAEEISTAAVDVSMDPQWVTAASGTMDDDAWVASTGRGGMGITRRRRVVFRRSPRRRVRPRLLNTEHERSLLSEMLLDTRRFSARAVRYDKDRLPVGSDAQDRDVVCRPMITTEARTSTTTKYERSLLSEML